jgi:3-oxoacyl-[acyl-carrier protein] reductase
MFRLTSKNALVTGATGGIGAAIVESLIKQGANVVISGTKEDRLKELAQKVGEDKVKILPCNLSNNASTAAASDKLQATCAHLMPYKMSLITSFYLFDVHLYPL